MVIEAKTKLGFDPNHEQIFLPNSDLIAAVEDIAEEKFRQRQIGKLITLVISTTHPRMDNDSYFKRDKALKGLSSYFPPNPLTKFIARLEDSASDRKPIVASLLRNKEWR